MGQHTIEEHKLKENHCNVERFEQKENPQDNAGLLSFAFFWWLHPLLTRGYKKDLDIGDIPGPRKQDKSQALGDLLEAEWAKEEAKSGGGKGVGGKASLASALIRCFGLQYSFLGLFTLLEECAFRISQPLFMGWMMEYFSEGSTMTSREAYSHASGVVLCSAAYTFFHHPYTFGLQHVGMKMRVASSAILYRKALKLSNSSLGQTTIGQMVNLLSNDVNRFDQTIIFLHYLWCAPLQLAIVTGLLYQRIGPYALVAVVLLVSAVPFQSWMGRQFAKLRVETATKTDKRIRLMNEIINGMKVIKMYTWEEPFARLVHKARKEEIGVIRKTAFFRAFNLTFSFTASRFILFCTFLVYSFTGEVVTAETAFLCLSMFNILRLSITLFFPLAISQLGEMVTSIKRIQDFLLLEEKAGEKEEGSKNEGGGEVVLMEVTARWESGADQATLEKISLQVGQGELLAVVGPVGSGKSSVLQVILGELQTSAGERKVRGSLSYSPQEAWLFPGSIRANILFGEKYEEERYRKVIQACALEHDLTQWEYGDSTLVGDRGVALSGGQRARVTLARACYRKAGLYLLDDPLSAVDAEVGRHLFKQCIRGFLKDKAVLLVTHQLHHLKEANHILALSDGRIQQAGNFQQLRNLGMDFSKFLASPENDEDEKWEGKDKSIKTSDEKDSSLVRRRSSQCIDKESKKTDEARTDNAKRGPSADEEGRNTGSVAGKVFSGYLLAGSNCFVVFFVFASNLLCQAFFSGSDVWLSYWTSQNVKPKDAILSGDGPPIVVAAGNISTYDTQSEESLKVNLFNLGIYGGLVAGLCVASVVRTISLFVLCMRSSVALHDKMFKSITRAPCRFFDTNPVGRILNRFSKDIGSMDEQLPPAFFDVLTMGLTIAGILAVVTSVRPWSLLPILPLTGVLIVLRRFYMGSSRDIKRLEGVSKSPVFSQLSTSLQGLTTIRAFKAEQMLQEEFDHLQDVHTSTWFAFISTTRWFGLWLDWIVTVYMACVVYSFLLLSTDLLDGEVGLAISSCMMLEEVQWMVRQTAEVENLMTSVERVREYCKLASEAPAHQQSCLPSADWPDKGQLQLEDVSLRYHAEGQEVLKQLNFSTHPHEKIGIVGRSGAGKSSIVTALFRLAEPSGKIVIDGIDALKLGLRDLRSKISIIPQEPVMFNGSFRSNLDPFEEHDDATLWNVLHEVHLANTVSSLRGGLQTEMREGGTNLSVGERQLACLARAILSRNRILVLDEATANVDPKTDALIQEKIREKFHDCTVLTIAHRLHTVMDCDRILVLSDGRVAEFDKPCVLLNKRNGVLSELADQTGERRALEEIANASTSSRL